MFLVVLLLLFFSSIGSFNSPHILYIKLILDFLHKGSFFFSETFLSDIFFFTFPRVLQTHSSISYGGVTAPRHSSQNNYVTFDSPQTDLEYGVKLSSHVAQYEKHTKTSDSLPSRARLELLSVSVVA